MSEGTGDVLLLVPYHDPDLPSGTVTFAVCSVEDLTRHLLDDDPEPDDTYADGIVGAIQRAAIDGPTSVGSPKVEETLRILTKAGESNSAEGRFTYWDPT